MSSRDCFLAVSAGESVGSGQNKASIAGERPGRTWARRFALLATMLAIGTAAPVVASVPAGSNGSAAEVPADWWTQAQKHIAAEEYSVSWQDETLLPEVAGAYQAPNRAQDLRTYFTEAGPRVIRRTAPKPDWVWGLEFTGIGNPDAQATRPALQKIDTSGNRVEYRRGDVVEWYINSDKGLEQGFTIATNQAGGDRLVVSLGVRGDLAAGMMPDGETVEFLSPGGVGVIHYGHLETVDAAGRKLPSEMTVVSGGKGIALQVDVSAAVFPITIDPLATSAAWTAESDQANARLGCSAATAGDVNGDGYGDVIVGASLYDNGQTDEGRAYVYLGSASGLAASAAWTAESDQASAQFGISAATAGDVNGDGYADVIIGADLYDNGQTDEGRAFVYLGSASGLATTAAWTAESNQATAEFGYAAASAGDVNADGYSDVIVGAYNFDNGQSNEGRAFVYLGSASGLAATAAWTTESNQANAYLGAAVATAGDVNGDGYADVIVGAEGYDNGQVAEGRSSVFLGSASGLATSAAWTAESDQAGAGFGVSVATAGDVNGDGYADVIVGAWRYDNGQADEGRASVYLGSASGLATSAAWTAESDQDSAEFGVSVATAGDVNGDGYADVIVGAWSYDNGQADEGRASVFLGSASGLAASAAWTAESDQDFARHGWSVATAGDVNGDGYADVIVGALLYDNGQSDEGRASVYLGSASGLAASAAWTGESDQVGAQLGVSAATAGDVNGDGYADVIVGAPSFDNGETDEGRAFLYLGSASGLAASAAWTAESDQAGVVFGISVSTAGDVNGDGYADVIVGAERYSNGQTAEGRAYAYLGSASGLAASAAWTAESDQASAAFGRSVSTAGDVNGDGYADVIVGAMSYDNGQTDEGRAFVYLGSASGLATSAAWMAESNQSNAGFGVSVSTAGDVNGDGYADVVVGAWFYDNGQTNEGRAFVYRGSASGLAASAAWTAESNQASAFFGFSVATAGDVNGDGYADVIVGAVSYDNGQTDEGRASVYLGSASGLAAGAAWTAESNQFYASFGQSVATAGDVNGDGYADVIVGAPDYDNGQAEEGRVSVYYGNGEAGRGLSLAPRQRRGDDTAPIAHLGSSDSDTSARLAALGRTPFGRGRVKLEAEVKPLGTSFDGSGTVKTAAWTDTGTAGVELSNLLSGLTADTVYRGRMRLLYDPAGTPYQQSSRWFTMPWNGGSEADFRTAPLSVCGNSVVESGEQCDDGNIADGDCCSSSCQYESSSVVCRASTGQCDVAENCTGSSGTCPTDAFEPTTTACAGASQAGVCDDDALDRCSGSANTCVDAYRSAATECRADTGQCDVAETCTGSSGACPADAFEPTTTACTGTSNGGACDVMDHCLGTANTCVDEYASAATECRAGAGPCDMAENCTGSASNCPADGFAPGGTACPADGNLCTDDVCDGAGGCGVDNSASCDDGSACTEDDTCSGGACTGSAIDCDDDDLCTVDTCDPLIGCDFAAVPVDETLCLVAAKAKLQVADRDGTDKDKLSWHWGAGEAYDQADLGSPDTDGGTRYALCVYDEVGSVPQLVTSLQVPGSAALWIDKAPKGFQYKDKAASAAGVTKIQLAPGIDGKTKARLSGARSGLALPGPVGPTYFEQDGRVVVQLVNDEGGCWTSEFTPADTSSNEADAFKAQVK